MENNIRKLLSVVLVLAMLLYMVPPQCFCCGNRQAVSG